MQVFVRYSTELTASLKEVKKINFNPVLAMPTEEIKPDIFSLFLMCCK